MVTQVIRDTEGVITTGKFCLFGGSKKQKISCDNESIVNKGLEMSFCLAPLSNV